MMWYYIAFSDDTGCEIEARDKQHAYKLAKALYPKKTVAGIACCEYLDTPF